jgi:hypothetical protein
VGTGGQRSRRLIAGKLNGSVGRAGCYSFKESGHFTRVVRRMKKHKLRIVAESCADLVPTNYRGSQTSRRSHPPRLAELLVAFCVRRGIPKGRCKSYVDTTIDDLEDEFQRNFAKFGRKRARSMYWDDALNSSWPYLRDGLVRVIKWGAAVAIAKLWSGRW